MKKIPLVDGGSLDDFLRDPIIVVPCRPGDESDEKKSEGRPAAKDATPAPDAAPNAVHVVGNRHTS